MWYVKRFVEADLQLSFLPFFLMPLTLAKHKLARVLTYLPLSVSSALTAGGQPGVQQIPVGPPLPGVCQLGFSSPSVCLCGGFVDLSWAVTQTGSWGGGACQVVGKRGCWQRVRKARQPFLLSHVLALHTACCPFPLAFPFQAGYDAIFHWLAIG